MRGSRVPWPRTGSRCTRWAVRGGWPPTTSPARAAAGTWCSHPSGGHGSRCRWRSASPRPRRCRARRSCPMAWMPCPGVRRRSWRVRRRRGPAWSNSSAAVPRTATPTTATCPPRTGPPTCRLTCAWGCCRRPRWGVPSPVPGEWMRRGRASGGNWPGATSTRITWRGIRTWHHGPSSPRTVASPGTTTRPCSPRGARGARGSRCVMPGCARCARPGGCTIVRGWWPRACW